MLMMSRGAAAVTYDRATEQYVESLGMDFLVAVKDRTISRPRQGDVLLKRLGISSSLILWYLVSAKDIDCTRR
jgi:hypothetical protein